MATTTANQQNEKTLSPALVDNLVKGVVAGWVGGAVFGVMMAAGGMLPMVASMIGSESVVIGFIVHMLISAVIGGTYVFVAQRLPQGWLAATGAGVLWGIVWWVLGALIIMPLVLGMGEMVLVVGDMQWSSLIGHAIFGIFLGVFYALFTRD